MKTKLLFSLLLLNIVTKAQLSPGRTSGVDRIYSIKAGLGDRYNLGGGNINNVPAIGFCAEDLGLIKQLQIDGISTGAYIFFDNHKYSSPVDYNILMMGIGARVSVYPLDFLSGLGIEGIPVFERLKPKFGLQYGYRYSGIPNGYISYYPSRGLHSNGYVGVDYWFASRLGLTAEIGGSSGGLFSVGLCSRTIGYKGTGKSNSGNINKYVKVDLSSGITANFVSGDFITSRKALYELSDNDYSVKGKIKPSVWFTTGIQLRYLPFAGSDNDLKKLSVGIGLNYFQRGFTNEYQLTNTGIAYSDVTNYRETLRMNYLGTSLLMRYGNRWYGEAGVSFDRHLASGMKHTINRETSGSEAYKGAFSSSGDSEYYVDKNLIKSKQRSIVIAAGCQVSEHVGIKASINVNSNPFVTGSSFRNIQPSLQFTYTF